MDVYSLGAILYELLTGQPPFRAATQLDTILQVIEREPVDPRKLNANADRDLCVIALKCLEKEPVKRYGSAEALAEELERWLCGEPILARPTSPLDKSWKWAKRRPALAAAMGLASAAAVSAIVLLVMFGISQNEAKKSAGKHLVEMREVNDNLTRIDENRKAALRRAAALAAGRGIALCQERKPSQGLLWLTQALEALPEGNDALEQSIRLHLAGWSRDVAPLIHVEDLVGTIQFEPLAFSNDVKLMVVRVERDDDPTIAQVLELNTTRPIGKPMKHDAKILQADFAADAANVITLTADNQFHRWNYTTGEQIATGGSKLTGAAKSDRSSDWSSIGGDGRFVLTVMSKKSLDGLTYFQLWDSMTAKPIGEPFLHAQGPYGSMRRTSVWTGA